MMAQNSCWVKVAMLLMLLGVCHGASLIQVDGVNQIQALMIKPNETSSSIEVDLQSESIDWMATMKTISLALVPILIPEEAVMAAAIGVMIEVFWPQNEEDVWDKIEDQVQDLVDEAILKEELENRQGDINALLADMYQYVEAKGHEKAYWMNSILAKCIDTNEHIKIHEDTHPHTIGVTITLAYIHLNMLRERLLYGKFMYNEDNSEFWRQDLEYQVVEYQNYLSGAYKEWQEDYLNDRIHTSTWEEGIIFNTHCHGKTEDTETKLKVEFIQSGCTISGYFDTDVARTKTYMKNELRGKFMQQLYQASFELIRFVPGMENHLEYAMPQDRILEFGPYSSFILQQLADGHVYEGRAIFPAYWDEPNSKVLTNIAVREDKYIDGLQFTYEDFEGQLLGSLNDSPLEFTFDGKNVTLLNVTMGYGTDVYNDGLEEMQLWFSDGTTSGPLGNHGGTTNLNRAMAGNISPRFKCTSNGGSGSAYASIGTMYLRYMHDVPDDEITEYLANQYSMKNLQLLNE